MADPAMPPRAAYMPRRQAILLGIGEARLYIPESDAPAFIRLLRGWVAEPGHKAEFAVAPFGPGDSITIDATNAHDAANAIAGAVDARNLAVDMTNGTANG